MSNINKFLDTKQGKFIGRVYLLVILFICNTAIAAGATLLFNFEGSPIIMVLGIIGTVIIIAILSTPCHVDESLKTDKEEK